MSIVNLKNQFEEIRNTKGKGKESVIAKYKHDELFKEVAQFVFSPYFTTGIAKKKMTKELGAKVTHSTFDVDIIGMLGYIRKNNSGSDAVIKTIQSWILSQPEETHDFLREVFTQDMQIGATASTFNKVLGDKFIPQHEIQLAKSYKDDADRFTDGEFAITLKIDGYRATVFNTDEGVKILSKGGLPFEGLLELESQFSQLPKGVVYDGELLWHDETMRSDDRFRKTGSALKTKGIKTGIIFMMFDILLVEQFEKGESAVEYWDRLASMKDIMKVAELKKLNLIQLVPIYYIGTDKSQIIKWMEHVKSFGAEGLILNDMASKYYTTRHFGVMKVKEYYTVDLRITGYREYKHPNMLGAFKVDFKGNDAWIGGGYTLDERAVFWEKRDEMIGSIIEVEMFQESNNKSGGLGVRHGNFLRLRWDKNNVSYT